MLRLGSRFGAHSKSMVFKARGENAIPQEKSVKRKKVAGTCTEREEEPIKVSERQ